MHSTSNHLKCRALNATSNYEKCTPSNAPSNYVQASLASTDSDTFWTWSQDSSSLLPEKQHSSSEESPSLSEYSIATVCLHHFPPGENTCFLPAPRCMLSSGRALVFYSLLRLQTWGLGERSQLLRGFLGCIMGKYKQGVILEPRRGCAQVGTAPALGTCQKPCQETLYRFSSLTPRWN